MQNGQPIIQDLGHMDYQETAAAMHTFTTLRKAHTDDEIWLVEHPSVYTQGQAGKADHLLRHTDIPVIHSDRGGQITYHGPGQLVVYTLIDLKRRQLNIKQYVTLLEQTVIDWLATLAIDGQRREKAPGVYIQQAKIASLGLRVKKGCTYHGMAVNVAMDLSPFNHINPCGYKNMPITQVSAYTNVTLKDAKRGIVMHLLRHLLSET